MNYFQKRLQAYDAKAVSDIGADDLEFAVEAPPNALDLREERIDVEAVADLLTDRKAYVRRGLVYWIWTLCSPVFGIALLASLVFMEPAVTYLSTVALMTVRILTRQTNALQQTRAALQNSHLDSRWLGALCEALEWPDRRVRGSAALLLIQFLPRLAEGDGELFNEVQLNCLYRRLTIRAALSDPELALVILRALPYIGTAEALPYVERLATRPALSPNMRRVRNAARASFALLERRAAWQRDRQAASDAAISAECMEGSEFEAGVVNGHREAEHQEMAAIAAHVDMQLQEFEAELRKLQVPGMRLGFLVASWIVIVPFFLWKSFLQYREGSWPGAILCAILALVGTQLHRLTLTRQHQILARRLTKIEDVRSVGRLAEMLEWPDPTIRHGAITALTRLLRQVKATDNVLQTPRQRNNLYRMLNMANARQHSDLLVAILQALQQIGDANAVPNVKNLADAQPVSPSQRRVCDAARDCLPFLETRAKLTLSSQTLLRASSATTTGTDLLVRPASGVNIDDQEQLLRAGHSGDTRG
jgi:hypothetical protein